MLDVGAIWPSNSPWASAVVLVWKKDGNFCIDLWKLNARMIKDAYSLPQIDETLDCLNGTEWFSSLDLKSGYWQAEMEENNKVLSAFTVGPLGFYECKWKPFRLTNAPATFQWLMQSCLGQFTSTVLYDISWWYHSFFQNTGRTFDQVVICFWKAKKSWVEAQTIKLYIFKQELTYVDYVVSKMIYRLTLKRLKQFINGPGQLMLLK